MINASSDFKQNIINNRKFKVKADVSMLDGETFTLTENDIVVRGLRIEDSTSEKNRFNVGSAIINTLTLIINNINENFNEKDFIGAEIRPKIGLYINDKIEYVEKGVFTVIESTEIESSIHLSCLDHMHKLEKPFKKVSMIFPTNIRTILNSISNYCGVVLNTQKFDNDTFIIQKRPEDDISCRQVVAYLAQITGNYARFDNLGFLKLDWYNSTKNHLISHISKQKINTEDVEITGIDFKTSDNSVLFGEEGYTVKIENNPFAQNINEIGQFLASKLVGLTFRPLQLSILSDPTIEAGDMATVVDKKGEVYTSLITNTSYSFGQAQTLDCDAESVARNNYNREGVAAKIAIKVKDEVQDELNAVEIAAKQFNDMVVNSMGLYPTVEELEDGSLISYMHDKPELEESLVIWKKARDTFSVSNDGGETWHGMDSSGNVIANVLSTVGVNAEWINVIDSFTVGDKFQVLADGVLTAIDGYFKGVLEGGLIRSENFLERDEEGNLILGENDRPIETGLGTLINLTSGYATFKGESIYSWLGESTGIHRAYINLEKGYIEIRNEDRPQSLFITAEGITTNINNAGTGAVSFKDKTYDEAHNAVVVHSNNSPVSLRSRENRIILNPEVDVADDNLFAVDIADETVSGRVRYGKNNDYATGLSFSPDKNNPGLYVTDGEGKRTQLAPIYASNLPSPISALKISDTALKVRVKGDSEFTEYGLTKDSQGRITKITQGDEQISVTWE